MDLRSVECFLRVADTLHFAQAAAELHLSQPALSQRIRTLEREIGATLLERNRRGVALTAAGHAFREPAMAALSHGRHAAELARHAAGGTHGRLRLGFTVIASYTWLPRAVQAFRASHPDVVVALTEVNSPGVEAALHRGDIDLGILHPPLERTGLQHYPLPDEPIVLALPAEHPLATRTQLTFADLAGEPMLVAPRSVGPALFDTLMSRFRTAGVEPRVVQEATPMTTLAGLVAAGAGIGFVTAGIAAATRPGVVFRPVTDTPGVPLAAAWRTPEPTAVASRFLVVADEVSGAAV